MLMRPLKNEEVMYWLQTGMLPYILTLQPTQEEAFIQSNPLFQQIRQNWSGSTSSQAEQETQGTSGLGQIGAGMSTVGNYMMSQGNPVGALVAGVGNLLSGLGGK